jgi:hypothetical protein
VLGANPLVGRAILVWGPAQHTSSIASAQGM